MLDRWITLWQWLSWSHSSLHHSRSMEVPPELFGHWRMGVFNAELLVIGLAFDVTIKKREMLPRH